MGFNDILAMYSKELETADFEIIQTPKLGWIYIATRFSDYSNPIKQFSTPQELEEFIKCRI